MAVSSLHFYPPPSFPPPEQRDVLIFQSFLLQKRVAPSSILEGSQAVYSVKLNGPPPTDVAIELNASDQLTRYVCVYTICKETVLLMACTCSVHIFLSFPSFFVLTYLPSPSPSTTHRPSYPHSPISMYSSPPSSPPSTNPSTFHFPPSLTSSSILHLLPGPQSPALRPSPGFLPPL